MNRKQLARLLGADKPRVIGVFTDTAEETALALAHLRGGDEDMPVRVWPGVGLPLDEVRLVWLALSVVAWTGRRPCLPRGFSRRILPLLIPPFRVLVLNEAGDFFRATPRTVAGHALRRLKDAFISGLRRAGEIVHSIAYRAGQRIRDVVRLIWSFAYRAGQRILDALGLLGSLAYRGGERARDFAKLGWSMVARAADLIAELSLVPLAGLAALIPSAVLRALIGGRGRPSGPLQYAAGPGTFTEVQLKGRRWPRRQVEQALRTADAEFIVLRRAGEKASARPLIRMALRTGAFAVAKQTAWSAWRSRVVSKHPFRRLQPGEVSEVLAPWSTLMVFRCDTLLRLGCPRGLTAGGALMTLFRRSSAVGLRNLVLGHDEAITDEPAMALEDLEFAARVALSPKLARLAPADPHASRGNLAHSPYRSLALRGLPRVLIVSPYLPFPLSHGGAVRIWNLCRAMKNEVDFTLACFREAGEHVDYDALHEVFREVHVVDIDEKDIAEKNLGPPVPRQVAEYRNPAMSNLVARLCLAYRVDFVQLEYTQMASYAGHTGSVPVILVEHDITFTLHEQLASLTGTAAAKREAELWRTFERGALQCSHTVWAMSPEDREIALAYGAPKQRTWVVPNGVDLEWYRPALKPRGGPPVILFVGSFRHLPNLLAFEVLRNSVMPEVWSSHPDAELHVVAGPDHERAAKSGGKTVLLAPDPRVFVRGFVEDVRPFYRASDVVVVPLPVSAGTNIKVMEAMACGLPVISTPAGCQGLGLVDGRHIVVADADGDFGASVTALLRDPGLQIRLGMEARKVAQDRFGWDSIARKALSVYNSPSGQPKSTVSGSTSASETVSAGD